MYYVWLDKNDEINLICEKNLACKLGMNEEELLLNGVYVELLPESECKLGFDTKMRYSKENGLYYDYIPRPLNLEEQINSLGEQLTQEKLKNIQKDTTISQLGQEIAKLKLEVISIKGGV